MSKELEISFTSQLALPSDVKGSLNLKRVLAFTVSSMAIVGTLMAIGVAIMAGSALWLFMLPLTAVGGGVVGYGLLPQFFLISRISRMLKKNGAKLTLRDKISIWTKDFNFWEFGHKNESTGVSIAARHNRTKGTQEIYVEFSAEDDINTTLHNALIVKNGNIGTSYDESNHVILENTTKAQDRILDQVERMNKSLNARANKDKIGYSVGFSEDTGLNLRFEKDDMFNELKAMCEKDFNERMNKAK